MNKKLSLGENMYVHLPLKEMSISDKLDTMEALWNSLCKTEELIDSPKWHQKVLAQRENETFLKWDESKKEILRTIHDS